MEAAELDRQGIEYISASYPFDDHGKSILMEATYGYVKVLADPGYGRILGAEIVVVTDDAMDFGSRQVHCMR